METLQRRDRRRGIKWFRVLLLLLFICGLAAGGYIGWLKLVPNNDPADPIYQVEHPLLHQGKIIAGEAMVDGTSIKLPLPAVQELLGESDPIRYEAESGSIIMYTGNRIVHMKTEALTATMNQKPFELAFAAEMKDDIVYIPLEPLHELYGLRAGLAAGSGAVTLLMPGDAVQRAVIVDKGGQLRTEPSIKAPVVEQLEPAGTARLWGEEDGWYYAETAGGYVGYLSKRQALLSDVERIAELEREDPFIAWEHYGSKINLTWEAVYNRRTDIASLGSMSGVNVVSPTWFELIDGAGNVRSKADEQYMEWARANGKHVWAMFSNSFDPDLTTEALSTYEARLNTIKQLLSYASIYKLQGINIDYENVYTKDKENLVQFVREMTPLMHEQGLVVSIDVTPKSNSEMWSAFLDRKLLGEAVDFMMVMAYDEHWAASPIAGSVSSLPWVEQSIKRILEEDGVPSSKLIMGIPLYTRIWTEAKDADGNVKVSSNSVGMQAVDTILAEKGLTPVYLPEIGQHYVEYEEEGELKRIWIEDATSLQSRIELAKRYDLGGVATWARSFVKPGIWEAMEEALNKRP